MRPRYSTLFAVVLVGGCLVPRYDIDPPDTAIGGQTNASGTGNAAGNTQVGGTMTPSAGASNDDCTPEQKLCEGTCVDIDDAAYGCSPTSCNMSSCPAADGATLTCEAGVCVIGACGNGSKKCAGKCVAISDPNFGCGATSCDPSSCPDPKAGTLICESGTCRIGACGTDTKQCGNKCVPLDQNNGCSNPKDCTPCASDETCLKTPSVCTCAGDDVEACKGQRCGPAVNNCNETIECPNVCPVETPLCFENTCVQCRVDTDCPGTGGNSCARAVCVNRKCEYRTVASNTSCPGGTCSATQAGVCVRPAVNAGTTSIDATEVTLGQYYQFVKAKGSDFSGQPSYCSWNTKFTPDTKPGEFKPEISEYDYPVVDVNWCSAYAYCKWAGRRLCGKIGGGAVATSGDLSDPTKGQWMHACVGASNFVYPYGNAFVDGRCNGPAAQSVVAPVASHPQCVGGYPGLYDMSGNVSEWLDSCSDTTGSQDQCVIQSGEFRAFADIPAQTTMRCDFTAYGIRSTVGGSIGFRCCGP